VALATVLLLTTFKVGVALQLSVAAGDKAKAAVIPAVLLHCKVASNEPAVVVTVGAVLSTTVTTATQVAVLPLPSETVRVTLFVPILEQVNVVAGIESVTPQVVPTGPASTLPLSIAVATTDAVPAALSGTVIFLHIAVGATLSILNVAVLLAVITLVQNKVAVPENILVMVIVVLPLVESKDTGMVKVQIPPATVTFAVCPDAVFVPDNAYVMVYVPFGKAAEVELIVTVGAAVAIPVGLPTV
jgi:hypothetical protein